MLNSTPCIKATNKTLLLLFYSAIYCLNYCTFLDIKGIEIELSLLSYTKKPKHNITITNKVQLYNYNSTK